MNKILKTTKRIGEVFWGGFKVQITDGQTLGLSSVLGVQQGLKYTGNIIRGVATTAIISTGIATVNGIKSIAQNMDYIRQKEIKVEKHTINQDIIDQLKKNGNLNPEDYYNSEFGCYYN